MFSYFIIEILHFQLWFSNMDKKYICIVGLEIIGGEGFAERKKNFIYKM